MSRYFARMSNRLVQILFACQNFWDSTPGLCPISQAQVWGDNSRRNNLNLKELRPGRGRRMSACRRRVSEAPTSQPSMGWTAGKPCIVPDAFVTRSFPSFGSVGLNHLMVGPIVTWEGCSFKQVPSASVSRFAPGGGKKKGVACE